MRFQPERNQLLVVATAEELEVEAEILLILVPHRRQRPGHELPVIEVEVLGLKHPLGRAGDRAIQHELANRLPLAVERLYMG